MTTGRSRIRDFAGALTACALFYQPGFLHAQSVAPTVAKAPDPSAELQVQSVRTGLAALQQLLEENQAAITPDFVNALANLSTQMENGEDREMSERIRNLSRVVLRYSMMKNMKG